MQLFSSLAIAAAAALWASQPVVAQAPQNASAGASIRRDPGTYGPALELVHQYFGQWPTGVAVSSQGRIFSNFPAGLDANNTNTGRTFKYQVAEIMPDGSEVPYPTRDMNNPPGGSVNASTSPPTAAVYPDYLIGVQSVVIDAADRLWILDTGRVIDPASGMTLNNAGGAKLVGVNLANNTVFKTITFPQTVAYPDSYLNDVRFDLTRNLSSINGTQGVAYITDSSNEGRNGIIIVDLASGASWRHLTADPRVRPGEQAVPFVWGQPLYAVMPGMPKAFVPFGSDGIALSADGATLFFSTIGGRALYSIPTARLRDNGPNSEVAATNSVQNRGEKGITDGMETDSNGLIYAQNAEQSSINTYNPANYTVTPFVRDPRISWADTMSVATNGYLYFTDNQFSFLPSIFPGTDRRVHPFALFRVKLPNNGTKADPSKAPRS